AGDLHGGFDLPLRRDRIDRHLRLRPGRAYGDAAADGASRRPHPNRNVRPRLPLRRWNVWNALRHANDELEGCALLRWRLRNWDVVEGDQIQSAVRIESLAVDGDEGIGRRWVGRDGGDGKVAVARAAAGSWNEQQYRRAGRNVGIRGRHLIDDGERERIVGEGVDEGAGGVEHFAHLQLRARRLKNGARLPERSPDQKRHRHRAGSRSGAAVDVVDAGDDLIHELRGDQSARIDRGNRRH